MIKIVIEDAVFTTEDFYKFDTKNESLNWVDLRYVLSELITWDAAIELFEMATAFVKLNEKGFCIKVEYVDGTWDVDILNATPQESHISPYKHFNGEADKLFNVMAKLP